MTKHWVCTMCGYIYEDDIPFESLPQNWICPICGEDGKTVFQLQ
ncbi:MAG: rubredoxin [Alphaproteobacteria bacterium]|nr:rubredoxin [Alphaproteobacteria bacterium]